ncbi:MAG: type II toxin-antitoxin system VapC family toxin [Coriobacteriales bacterium]|jgi:predicted nucleic-acid-binding protein|nr:type II toxin-antitoxin system VapC family toxin [Coriobacteriales bacterium]
MIGIDTNVLVRLATADDDGQTEKARRLYSSLSASDQGYLGLVALAEAYWVLRSVYQKPKAEILTFIDRLTETKEVAIQDAEVVQLALEASAGGADFADALIACSCKAKGCSRTVTFDQRAARSLGMELL